MGKRSRDRSCSDHDNCEFFKVYLPSFSSKQLGIPPAFVRHLDGAMPKHVILRDYAGRRWCGKMEKVEGGLVIKDCWERFAHQHSLELGDFLIFKYNGRSLFDVKIFGKNGCRREETVIANINTTHVKKETETEAEQTFNRDDQPCKLEYQKTVLKTSEKFGDSSGASQVKTIKRDGRNLGECKVFKVARHVVPTNPYFVSVISRYSRYAMSISVPEVKSHCIKLKPDMMLLDQNGEKWPVKVTLRTNGRIAITGGWNNFWRKNKLQIGDKCVFEFVLSRGNISKEMKVQVLRKGAANAKYHRSHLRKT